MRCPSLKDLPSPPPGKTGWPWTEESPRLPGHTSDGYAWPRVSIVTPSFNQSEYIEETIRSVLLQGYPNLEYIVMDGGSTDGSVDIICKYEQWLTYWVSQPDQGQTHAINEGWKSSAAEILTYINSDDCYLPGTIAAVVKGFLSKPHCGMVYGTAIVMDARGEKLRIWKGQKFNLETMLTVGSIVPQPAAFFMRQTLENVGYLDEQFHMIMDFELFVRIGTQFPTLCLPAVLAKFRDHSQSKSHSGYENMARELIGWMSSFTPPQVSPKQWRTMKRTMLSRVHYEWAINHLARGRKYAFRALLQLIKSICQYPLFALKRPMDTAYMIKEILLSFIRIILTRLSFQNRKQQSYADKL